MATIPKLSIWVLDTDWIYSIKVPVKWSHSNYFLLATHNIPFCIRYEENMASFLERHPALFAPIHRAIHDWYGHDKGRVDFNQQGYKYIRKLI